MFSLDHNDDLTFQDSIDLRAIDRASNGHVTPIAR